MKAILEQTWRKEHGQILATLMAWLGDLELAEDVLQDAFLSALKNWEQQGVPARPGAWLTVAARRKALDHLRKNQPDRITPAIEASLTATEYGLGESDFSDERLKLIFICCHPALPIEQRVALTLHTLGGLKTPEIAAAFLVPVPTMAQRLVRAKKKIREAGIPYYVPPPHRIGERVNAVLSVLYLIFTEGYAATSGDTLIRQELCEEAIYLCRLLEALIREKDHELKLPAWQKAETIGLLALMLLTHARRKARVDGNGMLVLLEQQDRSLWDQKLILEGVSTLDAAFQLREAGPYQLQAAITSMHTRAGSPEATAWGQIVQLYDKLLKFEDTPIVRLNRAVAISMAKSPAEGLVCLDELGDDLEMYAPYHMARADLCRRAGNLKASIEAYQTAKHLTQNEAERTFVETQIQRLSA